MTTDPAPANLPRPTPQLDLDNTAYWTGGRDGKLMINRCQDCGYRVHPPTSFCPSCDSRSVIPEAVSGRGSILSMTVNHKPWLPGLQVPYIVAMVAIEEQADVHLITNIVGAPVETVSIGDKVEVLFEPAQDIWVPLFRPVGAGA
jgi:uncharacterized OB-fold protein